MAIFTSGTFVKEVASTRSEEWSRMGTGLPSVLALGRCLRMLSYHIAGPVVRNEFPMIGSDLLWMSTKK